MPFDTQKNCECADRSFPQSHDGRTLDQGMDLYRLAWCSCAPNVAWLSGPVRGVKRRDSNFRMIVDDQSCLWCRSFDESDGGHFETWIFFLGGGFIFLKFSPRKLGKIPNLTSIFFRWVGEKPPASFWFEVFALFFSFITIPGIPKLGFFWTPNTKQEGLSEDSQI